MEHLRQPPRLQAALGELSRLNFNTITRWSEQRLRLSHQRVTKRERFKSFSFKA